MLKRMEAKEKEFGCGIGMMVCEVVVDDVVVEEEGGGVFGGE